MIYINKITKEYPLTEYDIKLKYPDVSFTDLFEAPEEFTEVLESEIPNVNNYQSLTELEPKLIDGKYYRNYSVKYFNIEDIRNIKLNEIYTSFENEFKNGKLMSSLGFEVDCRRDGVKFDKDNLQSLIQLNLYPIPFKDSNGVVHSLTEADANILLNEMINKGLWIYQNKWEKENQIQNATKIEDLIVIVW